MHFATHVLKISWKVLFNMTFPTNSIYVCILPNMCWKSPERSCSLWPFQPPCKLQEETPVHFDLYNIPGPLNRRDIADLPLFRTLLAICQKFWEPSFWEAMKFLFCNHWTFAMITSLSELYFRFRRFILMAQTKKKISIKYGSSTSSWKPWRLVRLDLILSMSDIYINFNLHPLTNFTSSSRSTEFKDIIPWNISQMITKTVPIITRIGISYAMKWGIPMWIWWKVNENWETTWLKLPNRGKFIVEQIIASKEINESNPIWDLSSKVNHLSKFIWDDLIKIITEFTRSITSSRIGKPVLMMDIKVSKARNIRQMGRLR